jgi:hypothetical protein
MAAPRESQVQPISPVAGVRSVQAIEGTPTGPVGTGDADARRGSKATSAATSHEVAATSTTGGLPSAYAQFLVDPDTHEVVVKIRDLATDKVLTELPSKAVQAADKSLREYAEFLARHRAMSQISGTRG